jgi:heme-degrading monooxygenase HmoA
MDFGFEQFLIPQGSAQASPPAPWFGPDARRLLMVVVIFRSRLRDDAGPDYAATAARMVELARGMPGFVSFQHYAADDGERVSLIEFASDDAVRAWREHPEHLEAQRRGRSDWYASYRLTTCTPLRDVAFPPRG